MNWPIILSVIAAVANTVTTILLVVTVRILRNQQRLATIYRDADVVEIAPNISPLITAAMNHIDSAKRRPIL